MAKKAALGKGLNALLPSMGDDLGGPEGSKSAGRQVYRFEDRERLVGKVANVEISQISPNPYQPRKDFDPVLLEELAVSIKELGIIQPITVRVKSENQFEIISGERRMRASKLAGLSHIPAYVRDADTQAMLEMALVENIQRDDLNPIEIALSYQQLMEECSLTQEQVASKVGKNRSTITNSIRLLKLPTRIQANLRQGTLSTGHARVLISVDDEEQQLSFADLIQDEALSVRQVERLVRDWRQRNDEAKQDSDNKSADNDKTSVHSLQLDTFRTNLRSYFSTKVEIKGKANGTGKIELEYYSDDDLERLLELLLQK